MAKGLNFQAYVPYLLNRAGEKIWLGFSEEITPLGVTKPMWRVLITLRKKRDYRLGELAADTSIDMSTLSRLLVTMQRRRLIVRRRSAEDGRALSVALTEQGRSLTEKIIPTALLYEKILVRGFSPSDVQALRRMLRKMYENVDEFQKRRTASEPAEKKRTAE